MHPLILTLMLVAGSPTATDFPPEAALALMKHEADTGTDEIVCIGIDGHDPSAGLLREIRRTFPHAVPASTCTRPEVGVTWKPTGADAALFSATAFTRTAKDMAVADFEVNSGPLGGNWYTAYFQRVHGHWVLKKLDSYMAS